MGGGGLQRLGSFGPAFWLVDVMYVLHHHFCETFVVKRTGKMVGHLR